MTERPKVGLTVIIRRDNTLLLGQRLAAHGYGSWGLPGGHLELGETFEECARRETLEECGLVIDTPQLAYVTNDIFPDGKHYVTLHTVANWQGGEAIIGEPDKCAQWVWFGLDQLPSPLMLPLKSAVEQGFNPFSKTMMNKLSL